MNLLRVRRLFAGEQVARFGTFGPGGRPQLIPVPFAVIDDGDEGVIVCAVETQPRSISGAARLRDVENCPRISFLADQMDPDGSQWWVQADAVGEVVRRGAGDPRFARAREALAQRYPQFAGTDSIRSLIWATVTGWTGYAAAVDTAA